jgi:hypothetical protein
MASLVGRGGGLCDRSVRVSERASFGSRCGVKDRACLSRSKSSLIFVRAADCRRSSVLCPATPDQSPDRGRAPEDSGEEESGVKAPARLVMFHGIEVEDGNILKLLGLLIVGCMPFAGLVTLPDLDILPAASNSR